ncbi:MAG: nicotinate-nicotinamide nucleotide adenylyltransferase, partial [Deltaproteobacteria bacterium]|nr:nicotinate-nicotinamide nucleotide adenylyltransferase [Deltaproteobacteria bacterium]
KGNPYFEATDIEIKRGGRSYTIETVRALMAEGYADISLILGSDSFNAITTWCEYETLLTLASFVVVERPGHAVKKPAEALPVELARKFWYDAKAGCYLNSFGKSLCYVPTTAIGISASGVRDLVKGGLSVKYLVPAAVEEFIAAKGLYKD